MAGRRENKFACFVSLWECRQVLQQKSCYVVESITHFAVYYGKNDGSIQDKYHAGTSDVKFYATEGFEEKLARTVYVSEVCGNGGNYLVSKKLCSKLLREFGNSAGQG